MPHASSSLCQHWHSGLARQLLCPRPTEGGIKQSCNPSVCLSVSLSISMSHSLDGCTVCPHPTAIGGGRIVLQYDILFELHQQNVLHDQHSKKNMSLPICVPNSHWGNSPSWWNNPSPKKTCYNFIISSYQCIQMGTGRRTFCTWHLEHTQHRWGIDLASKDPAEWNSLVRSMAGDKCIGIRRPHRCICHARMDLEYIHPHSLHSCNLHWIKNRTKLFRVWKMFKCSHCRPTVMMLFNLLNLSPSTVQNKCSKCIYWDVKQYLFKASLGGIGRILLSQKGYPLNWRLQLRDMHCTHEKHLCYWLQIVSALIIW